MNKKIIYILSAIVIFLLSVNIFLSFSFKKKNTDETKGEKYVSEMEFISSDNFIFDSRVLTAEGMTIEIPTGWNEEKKDEKISFYLQKEENQSEERCGINIQIGKIKEKNEDKPTIAEYIEILINGAKNELSEEEKEGINHKVFFIDGKKGLKTVFDLGIVKYIVLEIPTDDKIYIIESDLIFSDDCRNKFEEILKSISI
ncbi:MAG: hypothetical protein PHH17_00600 [Candidatus Pacebacteria bacterium]|jgi:hypothetical protein|nr:hypothetical protein [Candidatus Paceibacterota bacterium]MDD3072333.1 hypothetical protein [Candidatus Paceibacterota bacterium]MDD3728737.1 hypothetical protein [Candidatus Paceibacterota bacterium]MDD4201405.1 hypothetical protein [Candidatus Paceibacterota bacterium]MDD4466844.1 hypothetical protein [Candidatus Paceibacterota bacterium]